MPSPVSRSDQWDAICFPVRTEPLQNLLPAGYYVDASDRQKVVIAERMGEQGIRQPGRGHSVGGLFAGSQSAYLGGSRSAGATV